MCFTLFIVVRYVRLNWNQVIAELQEWQRLQNLAVTF